MAKALVNGRYVEMSNLVTHLSPEEEASVKKDYYMMIINQCKSELYDSDYKAIKYAEGLISEADYAPIKAERQALRDRINELEDRLEQDV